MATFSRISAGGAWVQGDDGAASSRVTFGGWIQINSSGGTSVTVTSSAQTLTLTQQSVTVSGEANVLPSAQSLSVALQSPTVSGDAGVSVFAQSLSLSQHVPTISTGGEITVNVSAFSLSLGQNTPFLSGDGASTPPLLGIVMGLHVPTIITPGLSVWDRRQNIDSIGWSNRRVTSAPAIVGSGSNGFTVLSVFMDGVIFWKPRNVRFGEIFGGNDEWVKRAKGSDIWNKRAIG